MAEPHVPHGVARRLLDQLRDRKQEIARLREPVAIVGMACRFPGGTGTADFWRLLDRGADAVSQKRPRAPDRADDGHTPHWGAFLNDIEEFDAEFFQISPLEAELLDPQQRMLLETCWEALEDSGLGPDRLRGSRTGVYCGISKSDYQELTAHSASEGVRGLYVTTGASYATAAGRVAFFLGLKGPAIAVDSACSSSLVAMHQAVMGLQSGDTDLALVAGVNAILTGGMTKAFATAGLLAPDGRCKTFDAAADGFVRGEGCGVVALKRLSDAEADGHRILGVLIGSAVNNDGASAGLTVPSGPAQERVIAAALDRAGIPPSSVDYLEAHGTGTQLGDPIELRAAASAYGRGRADDHPLLVGSVKTNIGHLEAAAGVGGVIKVLLSMQAGVIPKHRNFENPNPKIDWDGLSVRVTAEAVPWPVDPERPPRAGVSSFGFSGTNAHVVIEGYPRDQASPSGLAGTPVSGPHGKPQDGEGPGFARPDRTGLPKTQSVERRSRLLPLSARSAPALRELARRYGSWLVDECSLADLAWTASVGRSHFAWRAGVVVRDFKKLREQLEAVEQGAFHQAAREQAAEGKVAFLYTGQGSQWLGMGRELYQSEPVARDVFDRCEEIFREERGESLLAVMFGNASAREEGLLDRTEWTQPALYALECALTALWGSVGVRPEAVLGHSVGEIAAAQAAGVFGLEAGMQFATRRGSLMGALPSGGAMAAVFAPCEEVAAAVGGAVSVAADNGAHQVTSGPEDRIRALIDGFAAKGIRVEALRTSHAFHSELMDPALDGLGRAVGDTSPPALPLVSNLSGALMESAPDPAYWQAQARQPVQFARGVKTLAELGVNVLLEIGPRPVLGPIAALTWPAEAAAPASEGPAVLSSQRGNGYGDFLAAVAGLYEAGIDVEFEGLFAGERRRRISLPTYPFQRKRHWVGAPKDRSVASSSMTALDDLLYEVEWREGRKVAAPAVAQARPEPGRWVLVAPGDARALDAANGLASALAARGQQVLVAGDEDVAGEGIARLRVDPFRREAWRAALADPSSDVPLRGVVHLAGLDGHGKDADASQLRRDLRASCGTALALAQGMSDTGLVPTEGLWFVTQGGQTPHDEWCTEPSGAALWGFGRAAAQELAPVRVQMLDLDPADPASVEVLASEVLAPDGEREAAVRSGSRWTPRLVRRSASFGPDSGREVPADATDRVRGDRSYLVTGAFGGLGITVARWLADSGAGALILNGRRAPDATAQSEVDKVRDLGKAVRIEIADLTEEGAAEQMLDRLADPKSGLPPLGGLVHCAGVESGGPLVNQDWERFERVLGAKAVGAWRLHQATVKRDLDLFLLFSSIAGTLGAAGLANYSAANAFLDQLARGRRAAGLPGQAIAWGAWSSTGMAERVRKHVERHFEALGMGWMQPQVGVRALNELVPHGPANVIVSPVDWSAFQGVDAPIPAVAEGLVAGLGSWVDRIPDQTDLVERARQAPDDERETLLVRFLQSETQRVLRLDEMPSPQVGFFELGMDSLTAVALRNRLNRALAGAWTAPNTVAFDYPNVGSLARRVAVELGSAPLAQLSEHGPALGSVGEKIAVVGMACRFPGASSPEACGNCWRLGGRPSAWGVRETRSRTARRCGARSCPRSTGSMPSSSASPLARRNSWTRSSACCSRPAGRPWKMPGSMLSACEEPPLESISGSDRTTTSVCSPARMRAFTLQPETYSRRQSGGWRSRLDSRVRRLPLTLRARRRWSLCTKRWRVWRAAMQT